MKAQAPSSAQSQLVREPPSTASVPHDSPLRLQSEVSACLQHQVEALLVQGRSALEDSSLESSFSTRSQLVREFPSTALVHHATADLKRYSAGLLRFCPEVSAPAPHAEVSQVQGLPALSMASLASPSFAQSQLVRGSLSTAPVHDGPYVPCMAPAWLREPPFLCVRRDDLLPPLPQVCPEDDDWEARTPPPRPRIAEPGRPNNVAMIRAMHVQIFPEAARATPIFDGQLGTYSWSGRESVKPGFITVFDRVRHHVQMRVPAQASLHEAVALAVSSAPFSVGVNSDLDCSSPGPTMPTAGVARCVGLSRLGRVPLHYPPDGGAGPALGHRCT